jgi:hypothetical protein
LLISLNSLCSMGFHLEAAGRVVTDGHGEAVPVTQAVLESVLPGAVAGPVGPAAVGQDEQLGGVGVATTTVVDPPLGHVVDGKGRGVVGGADEDVAVVGGEVVDAVGQGDARRIGGEVVVVDEGGLLAPGGALVLEVADQLSFLGVDADDGSARSGEGVALGSDVAELGVAVGV